MYQAGPVTGMIRSFPPQALFVFPSHCQTKRPSNQIICNPYPPHSTKTQVAKIPPKKPRIPRENANQPFPNPQKTQFSTCKAGGRIRQLPKNPQKQAFFAPRQNLKHGKMRPSTQKNSPLRQKRNSHTATCPLSQMWKNQKVLSKIPVLCSLCSPIPNPCKMLTWATPVNIDILGWMA